MADEQFEEIQAALVAAADELGIGVVVSGPDRHWPTILYENQAASRLLGAPPGDEAVSATPFLASGLGVDAEPDEGGAHGPGPLPSSQFETTVQSSQGPLPLEVSCAVGHVAGRSRVVSVLVDRSERKRTEEALQRSETRFKHLIESAPEGVFIVSASRIVYANPTSARLFGVSSCDQLVGEDPRRFLHPGDVAEFDQRVAESLTERKRLAPIEYRIRHPGGSTVLLELSAIATDYQGQPGLLCFARDVTERKHTEAQLIQADRLNSLGLLAGGMAHAINNPLTYVLLNLDDVARRLPDVPTGQSPLPEAMARLKEAHQGAERIATVVRQMRAFSRPEDEVQAPVDLRRVLDTAIAIVENEIRHRGRLVTDLDDAPPVQASPARLEHVFLNLLLHVAQRLPEGPPEGEIRVVLRSEPPHRVAVEVSHGGPPLDAAGLARLFDPFFAGSESERTGLGLALCRSIVTSLGGTIDARSQGGQRTVFRVVLPADYRTPAVAPERGARGRGPLMAPLRRARIMVVDDDPGVVSALRLMLEEEHDVASVASVPEALQRLVQDDSFDVVFCDLMMPVLSGKDLYEALQLNCPGRERRLVFMTGGAFTPEAARFLEHVPNARLEKPFDMDSLQVLLRAAIA